MARIGNSYLTYGKILLIEAITHKIEKISLEDVKNLAAEIFDDKYYSLTVMGDIHNG